MQTILYTCSWTSLGMIIGSTLGSAIFGNVNEFPENLIRAALWILITTCMVGFNLVHNRHKIASEVNKEKS